MPMTRDNRRPWRFRRFQRRTIRLFDIEGTGGDLLEEPDSPTLETTEAPRPSIEARRRHFTQRSEEGV